MFRVLAAKLVVTKFAAFAFYESAAGRVTKSGLKIMLIDCMFTIFTL